MKFILSKGENIMETRIEYRIEGESFCWNKVIKWSGYHGESLEEAEKNYNKMREEIIEAIKTNPVQDEDKLNRADLFKITYFTNNVNSNLTICTQVYEKLKSNTLGDLVNG
jgi:hypothetical protein